MIRTLFSISLATALAGTLAAQAPAALGKDFWSDRSFVEKFMGSYGMVTSVEPKLNSDESDALKKFADEMKSGDLNRAESVIRKAMRSDRNHSAQLDFIIGNLAFQAGRVDDAIAGYNEAIRKFPDFRRAHNNLGILLAQRHEYKEAIKHLAKSVEAGGGDAITYGIMAYGYLELHQYLSAEIAYRNALVFAPDNADWILGLSKTLIEERKYDEAVQLLDGMLKKQPENADLWLFQANAFLGKGETNRAMADLEILRRLGKIKPGTLVRLGDLYAGKGANDIALSAYRDALAMDPRLPIPGLMRSAELLVASGGYDQGAALVAQIRATQGHALSDDDSNDLRKIEARIAAARGNDDAAAGALEQIIDTNPLDAEALLLLAGVYSRTGESEKADFLYSRAERIPGSEVKALVEHARFLVREGKYSAALPLLERAQGIKPDEHVSRFIEEVRAAARAASL